MPEVEIIRGTVETAESVVGPDGTPIPSAAVQAAVLQTAGEREAAVLDTAGSREAAVLKAAGAREAAILMTQGQRDINFIWENTQRKVALSVIYTSVFVASIIAIFGNWLGVPNLRIAAAGFLYGVANLVTGFYFGRTNHARTGGIGGDQAREDR